MAKRALDVVLGTLLGVLLLPLMVVLAVVAAITFRCWPLFVHERIGEGGRRIRFVKLRSMPRHAPMYATKGELDVDIPRFGRFLRRRHLDELPQLFLVPFGHLSLVGPRPAMPEEYEPVDPQYRAVRLTVPQGCTGLWQVGLHTDHLPSHAPEYDFFYVENANVRLDLLILWWTVLSVLGLSKGRSIDDIPSWACRPEAATGLAWQGDAQVGVDAAIPLTSPASAVGTLGDGIMTSSSPST